MGRRDDICRENPALRAGAKPGAADYTLQQFVLDFDGVTREQAVGVIEAARGGLLAELPQP